MVFEKTKAPVKKDNFIKWFEKQVEWNEDHDYDAIEVSSVNLKKWFTDMIAIFPPMNRFFAPDDTLNDEEELDRRLTDYSIGQYVIYVAFEWSVAVEAYDNMLRLALKNDVGFFDVSGNGNIIVSENKKLE